jgi:hypothetical protein
MKKPTLWVDPSDIETLRSKAPSMNISELKKLFGGRYTKGQIRKKMFMNGIDYVRSEPGVYHYRKYTYDDTFFDNIDTPGKAYVLGYWAADGCMIGKNNKTYEVSITSNDKEHLYLLRDIFKSDRTLTLNGAGFKNWKLCISNKNLYKGLSRLGFTDRKSLSLQYPEWLSPKLDSHFIRGFFDGDGCISVGTHNSIVLCLANGSPPFLEAVDNRIPIKSTGVKRQRKEVNTFVLNLSGDRARAFLYYIYQDSEGLRLKRKYDRYQDYLNREGIYAPPVMTDRILKNKERQLRDLELMCA